MRVGARYLGEQIGVLATAVVRPDGVDARIGVGHHVNHAAKEWQPVRRDELQLVGDTATLELGPASHLELREGARLHMPVHVE